MPARRLTFSIGEGETVSAILRRPRGARALYVFAHGAGAGMEHPFMDAMARRLEQRRIASFRYQFRYMEAGRKLPDAQSVLRRCARAAIDQAARSTRGLTLFSGGKSMGGRVSSHIMAEHPPERVRGLVFLGFPLHPPKKVGVERAAHLPAVRVPMLFLQGTRDALAHMRLIEQTTERLGRRATLHVVDGADHGFHVLKRSGRTDEEVLDELADTAARWMKRRASR